MMRETLLLQTREIIGFRYKHFSFKRIMIINTFLILQVFSSSGVFLKKFGTNGTGPGELDR